MRLTHTYSNLSPYQKDWSGLSISDKYEKATNAIHISGYIADLYRLILKMIPFITQEPLGNRTHFHHKGVSF